MVSEEVSSWVCFQVQIHTVFIQAMFSALSTRSSRHQSGPVQITIIMHYITPTSGTKTDTNKMNVDHMTLYNVLKHPHIILMQVLHNMVHHPTGS
jgi:hypothetical protein